MNSNDERKYYNKKLIKETFKEEIKKPKSYLWIDFLSAFIGCIMGNILLRVTGIEEKIDISILSLGVTVIYSVICFFLVKGAIIGIRKIIERKRNS
ncbi:MAG: hypothetical protein IJJ57_08385 [Ruminococcus sp.]|nr:hypothetical protein [Ruminococcus sp.]